MNKTYVERGCSGHHICASPVSLAAGVQARTNLWRCGTFTGGPAVALLSNRLLEISKNALYQRTGKYSLARLSTSSWIKQCGTTILSPCACEKSSATGTSAKFVY